MPQFKLVVGGETYINDKAIRIQEVRPENNISFLNLEVSDYKSESFVGVFDALGTITLSLRYGSDSWVSAFSGVISTVAPQISMNGEVLQVGAWGDGNPLVKTHCDTSYGVQSRNPTTDTPKEILQDIITNYVNKDFDGDATGWALTNTKVEDAHSSLSFTHLNSQYDNNFTLINKVCDVVNAYAQGLGTPEVSVHWFVDPSKNLYFKKIDADHTDGNWDHYYGGSQANATVEVEKDMIVYDFRKNVEEYANKIVLFTKFRRPGYDYWTEYAGAGATSGSSLWGTDATNHMLISDDNTVNHVGSYCIELEADNSPNLGVAFYPSNESLNLDVANISTQDTPAYINFYMRGNHTNVYGHEFRLFTGDAWDSGDWVTYSVNAWHTIDADKWIHVSVPLGPYHHDDYKYMSEVGTMDWNDLDGIAFTLQDTGTPQYKMYIDDLHITGLICREAEDTSELSANNDYQKIMRYDTAADDSAVASDDTGVAARLAYAELLRRSQTPIVGIIQIPMLPDLLPGQTLHVHACKQSDGTFRINKDMRVKELRHLISPDPTHGFRTLVNLTDDVTNTHGFGAPTQQTLFFSALSTLSQTEARELKGGGLDNLLPRLSKAY